MLNADNVARLGRGSAATSDTSTAIVVTLDASGQTAADSVVFVGLFGEGLTFATPSGWALVGTPAFGLSVYRRGPVEGLAAGETSWNFTPSATAGKAVVAKALECIGVDPNTTVDVVGSVQEKTSGTSVGPGTPAVTTYDGLFIALLAHRSSTSATPATWSNYQGSIGASPVPATEVFQQGQAGTGNSVALATAVATVQTIAAYSLVADPSPTPTAASPAVTFGFVINAVGARKQSDLLMIDGAEHGTIVGNTLGILGKKLLASVTAGVSISTAAARSGTYGWEFNSTAAACNRVGEAIQGMGTKPAFRRCFNLNGDTQFRRLWQITMTTSLSNTASVQIQMSSSSPGYLQCVIGSTIVVSDQMPPSSGWFAVDLRFDCSGSATFRTAEWSVDYDASLTDNTPGVPQGTVTSTTSVTGTVFTFTEHVGWNQVITSTMYSDDGGAAPGHNYPIGDLRVLPLKVDPAGTPTCTTSTNFGVMTNNGSVAAWNATNFRNAIDDVPPDLSGTRDAAVAIVASATDNADIPMATYDLAGNKVAARGVKFVSSVWAATATATTIRVFVYDGTTLHTVYAEADPNADSAAIPVWITGVIKTGSVPVLWSQAVVDALAIRFGSNDANPDIGLDMALLELAVVKALPETLFGEAGEPIYVEAHRDPDTFALVGATVNNNSGAAVKLAYEINGTPSETSSIPDGTAGLYVPLSADGSIETVGRIALIPG
jgi:hypothetical protein